MQKRTIIAGAAAALLVAGTGGAAIGANLTLLGAERDASGVGRLEIETARAELATAPLVDGATSSTTTAATVPAEAPAPAPAATTASGLTAAEAIAVAQDAVGGTLLEVEWSVERGRTVFEVTLRTEDGRRVEVYVDAADGTVVEIEEQGGLAALAGRTREDVGAALDVLRPDTTGITAERAIAIATAEVGGRVLEVEREREDGVDVYGVYLGQDDGRILDVMIDAVSGAVLRIEEEWRDDDDDDRDDRDDRDDAAVWSGVTGTIAPDAAVAAARAAVGGGDLVEVEREDRRGAPVYEVYLRLDGRTVEVYVDAVSGAVLEIDSDD